MAQELVFVHPNYPGQFGPIHRFLRDHYDCQITFLSRWLSQPPLSGIRHVPYKPEPQTNPAYFFSRFFEEECRNGYGVYEAVRQIVDSHPPDVCVGHVGFCPLHFVRCRYPELPTVGLFEIFYNPFDPATFQRPGWAVPEPNQLRIPLRNATQLIELEYCTRGYCPTAYQRSTFPEVYQPKLAVLFDGVDTDFYCPGPVDSASSLVRPWPAEARLVTYVSRGLEAFRGFDIFMQVADRLCQRRGDVHFAIAGQPKTHYGPETIHLGKTSFKDYVLAQHSYDLSRFHFLDWLPPAALRDLFRLSDCHFYWTVPFTLSWSLVQAMATGALVVAGDTAPVRDLLQHGQNGWSIPPYEIEGFVDAIAGALDAADSQADLRQAARQAIVENYSFTTCLPKLAQFYLQS